MGCLVANFLEVAEDFLAIHKLLRDDTSYSKHSEAAVLELLGLDNSLFGRIRRIPAKRIPVQITRLGIFTKDGGSLQFPGNGARLPFVYDGPALDESAEKDENFTEFREFFIE